MICREYRKVIWRYAHIWILTLLLVETKRIRKKDKDKCPSDNWRLSRGPQEYEGTIEMKFNGTWYNVCGDVQGDMVCSALDITGVKAIVHKTNVFNASLQNEEVILFKARGGCTKKTMCGTKTKTKCCEPVGICCNNEILGQHCSKNWIDSHSQKCYKTYGRRGNYAKARSPDFPEISMTKSWTKSALLGISEQDCSENANLTRDIVRNCANRCLNSTNVKKVFVSSKGECSCTGKNITRNECYKELEIVDVNTKPVELCIAVEVVDGTKRITAEDCGRYLPPLCVKVTDDDSKDSSNTGNKYAGDIEGDSEDVLMPSIVVFATFILVAVIIAVLCRLCRKSARKDPLRHNSVYNRTYDRQAAKNDEEYAIISEIELDSGATIYKPPLPERGDSSPGANTYHTINCRKDTPSAAVITLDDYSTPSDMIRDKSDVDLAVEYSTTYDDPIRHNTENIAEIKRKSETKECCIHDKQLSDANDSKNIISHTDGNINLLPYERIIDTRKEADIDNEKTSQSQESAKKNENDSDMSDNVETNDTKDPDCSSPVLVQSPMKKADNSLEQFTPPSIDVPSGLANVNEYEDTNIIDGNFPTRPVKGIFEEHVCLACLKPEHLQKLGIKLISEKHFDDFEKRLSEPPRKTHAETERKLRRCKTDVAQTDAQNNLITFTEDTNLVQNTARKCVECNNVYDRLGHMKETTQAGCVMNEYNRISNVQKQKSDTTLVDI